MTHPTDTPAPNSSSTPASATAAATDSAASLATDSSPSTPTPSECGSRLQMPAKEARQQLKRAFDELFDATLDTELEDMLADQFAPADRLFSLFGSAAEKPELLLALSEFAVVLASRTEVLNVPIASIQAIGVRPMDGTTNGHFTLVTTARPAPVQFPLKSNFVYYRVVAVTRIIRELQRSSVEHTIAVLNLSPPLTANECFELGETIAPPPPPPTAAPAASNKSAPAKTAEGAPAKATQAAKTKTAEAADVAGADTQTMPTATGSAPTQKPLPAPEQPAAAVAPQSPDAFVAALNAQPGPAAAAAATGQTQVRKPELVYQAPISLPPDEIEELGNDDDWYLYRADGEHGPYPFSQLQEWFDAQQLVPSDYIRPFDSAEWKTPDEIFGPYRGSQRHPSPPRSKPRPGGAAKKKKRRRPQ